MLKKVFSLVFVIGFVGLAWAQKEKPGKEENTFSFMKFTSGVLLDSGKTYRFENCIFYVPEGFSGIKAQKAVRLTVKNCHFRGGKTSVGIELTDGNLEVENTSFHSFESGISIHQVHPFPVAIKGSHFINNQMGIQFSTQPDTLSKAIIYPLTIQRNNFDGNRTAVNLQASNSDQDFFATDLTLKCNRFDKGNASYNGMYYGLKLGNNHKLTKSAIGGNGTSDFDFKYPSANIWPIAGNPNREYRPCFTDDDVEFLCGTSSWLSPVNWTSVANESSTGISIYRYTNEFVGTVSLNGGSKVKYEKRCYTDANISVGLTPGPNDVHECQNGLPDDEVVFPYRMAVTDSSDQAVTAISTRDDLEKSFLGQNIPNPGKNEVTIPFSLRSGIKSATITVRELASGRTIEQVSLSVEKKEVKLQVSHLSSGIYTYSLEADGELVQTRKLVIVK